ncbi:hypothetical protein ABFS82_10G162000 [Erythranthe guttata]|uniref:zeatin O-glucosyltransferase-like n=1 Tax=Erythranthe guttata TaxID=4155 RepID=UPI00064D8A0F|nr:PREDICTED: zeatin O-glucosyltransferase-like [Erythranthe guttata]|eukprot:XP_012828047.1 PREDICTED: zeatin O-glucosyltransferase-like [Erythranthe guttata]
MANNPTTQKSQVAVVMVPLPAQGHLNQLLHLSRRISAYNIPVYYVGAATHIRQVKLRRHLAADEDMYIHFHEFPTPHFENPPPDPNSPHKFPSQIIPSLKASTHLRQPISSFVGALSTNFRRVVVVFDSLMAYVVQDISNADCYTFRSISAVAVASWEANAAADENCPTEARNILEQTPSMKGHYPPEFQEFLNLQTSSKKVSGGEIYNSCREIEGPYLDLLARRKINNDKEEEEEDQKIWALGPFNPLSSLPSSNPNNKCLSWLDKHGPNSVILVSFGTTTSFSNKQIEEIALGLERSEQKFIWVLREADKGDIFTTTKEIKKFTELPLPEGFEERVKERGLVLVNEWAPQLEILGHVSTGGFLSHCGWNSCLEGISMGVPMATWPLHSDQPANAALVTKGLKIGVEAKKWCVEEGEVVTSADVVEEVVRKLMVSEEGGLMRKRAAELGGAVRDSWMEGGAAREEMEAFISHITR